MSQYNFTKQIVFVEDLKDYIILQLPTVIYINYSNDNYSLEVGFSNVLSQNDESTLTSIISTYQNPTSIYSNTQTLKINNNSSNFQIYKFLDSFFLYPTENVLTTIDAFTQSSIASGSYSLRIYNFNTKNIIGEVNNITVAGTISIPIVNPPNDFCMCEIHAKTSDSNIFIQVNNINLIYYRSE